MKELYRSHITALLTVFGSPEGIRRAPAVEIDRCRFLNPAQKSAILTGRSNFDPDKSIHQLAQQGIRFISIHHSEYPSRLKDIIDYPYGLFIKGELPPPQRKTVAVIGSRKCSYYGRKMAETIAETLARHGVVVVSGMAMGIDGYAQSAAVAAGGLSIGVLGSGVDICYPRQNRELYGQLPQHGAVISEYPPGREPLALHFPMRNRIISGLAEYLIVVEARERSGSLITADLALEQGRDIWAVPGRCDDILSSGCNQLIRQGAGIFLSVQDFLSELQIADDFVSTVKKNNISLETKEKLVYSCVDFSPKGLDEITRAAKLPVPEVMAALTILEIKGYIEEPMKNYYAKMK